MRQDETITKADRISFSVKLILTIFFCVGFVLFAGTVFESVGVSFGIEQAVMTLVAGVIGSYRLFSGT